MSQAPSERESPGKRSWSSRLHAHCVVGRTAKGDYNHCGKCAPCEAAAALVRLEDENHDLHLCCQGIKHYWLCKKNDGLPCQRCRAEQAEAALGQVHICDHGFIGTTCGLCMRDRGK